MLSTKQNAVAPAGMQRSRGSLKVQAAIQQMPGTRSPAQTGSVSGGYFSVFWL